MSLTAFPHFPLAKANSGLVLALLPNPLLSARG